MDTNELLNEIEMLMPLVERPKGKDISFHKDDCYQCNYVRRDLEKFQDKEIPSEGIEIIYDEMSALSSKGWRWVMPSFLRYCIIKCELHFNNSTDFLLNNAEIEFLIYSLSPDEKYEKETDERLSEFTNIQLWCLVHFLEWCDKNKYISEYHNDDID